MITIWPVGQNSGDGWMQVMELSLAFILSAIIGLEREYRQKSAGFRTYTLVGVAAALFMIVSKYGFTDVLLAGRVVLDPSRVAAQIVSGLGFIGGGVIFMRRDTVRGLTTAASVWLTAALGMAAGAGMIVIAIFTTICYLVVMLLTHKFVSRIMRKRVQDGVIVVRGDDEANLSGRIQGVIQRGGYEVLHVRQDRNNNKNYLALSFLLRGRSDYAVLINHLMQVNGVRTAWSEEPSKRWV